MCGRFRYEYSGVPVEEVHVLSCNCPICTDKGSLNLYVDFRTLCTAGRC